jgi:cyanophycinase
MTATPGRLALVGSGEYLPVLTDVEDWLFADNDRRYVQLATAAAPEGEKSLKYWHDLGAQAAARLDAEQVIVDVRTRADAFDARWVEAIAGAGLVYVSGGNPTFLADTLRDTPVWAAIVDAWRGGSGLAGCSAGAMAMGGYVPNYRHPRSGGIDGLQILPTVRVLPHFDRYTRWMPDFALRPLVTDDAVVLGIDEDTALVARSPDDLESPWEFTPRGRQCACEVTRGGTMRIERIALPVRLP